MCAGLPVIMDDISIHQGLRKWIIFAMLTHSKACYGAQHTLINSAKRFRWQLQYIPRNMHTVFALLCFVVVIHWLIFPYPLGLLHWQCGNLTIALVPAKQPWWIWINTSCEFIMNDYITTTKQSTTKPCAYFWEYTVHEGNRGGNASYHVMVNVRWYAFKQYRGYTVLLESISSNVDHNVVRCISTTIPFMYSISQEICTQFCCALLCCGYGIVHNEFTLSIYPYSSGLLCWHWGNR